MFPFIMMLGELSYKWLVTWNLEFNFYALFCFRDCLVISMARQVNIEVNVIASFFYESNQTFLFHTI